MRSIVLLFWCVSLFAQPEPLAGLDAYVGAALAAWEVL